jgi:hypothetical protein
MTTASERYLKAMRNGDIDTCIAIEQVHDLFGYPPELVSVGLKAIESDFHPHIAIAEYVEAQSQDLNPDEPKTV